MNDISDAIVTLETVRACALLRSAVQGVSLPGIMSSELLDALILEFNVILKYRANEISIQRAFPK